MKKAVLILAVATSILFSCSKDEPVPASTNQVVTAQFTSDTLAKFNFAIRLDTLAAFDSALTTSYQRDFLFSNLPTATGDTLRFTVYPPPEWIGTSLDALVNIKLFIGGVEKASNSGTITGADRPGGLTVYTVL